MKLLSLLSIVVILIGCTENKEDRSSIGFSAVQAQSSACIHAVNNGDNISFLNTCEYPINAMVFTSPPVELAIEAHTSIEKNIDLPANGLSFAACRTPYLPQKEVEGTYSCSHMR